jgi:hypothetical protein
MAALIAGIGVLILGAAAQEPPGRVEIPADATVLEGVPNIKVETGEAATTRRVLDKAEADRDRLRIRVVDGEYYWVSRGNRPLRLNASGAFTYLSSDPGQYIRFTRVNDRISYVEHVDTALGSVTWWGEMTIVVGAPRR